MLTAIIIPTLEEVDNIVPLVEQIEQTKVTFCEILFVEDGSTEGTRKKMRELPPPHRGRLRERDGTDRGRPGAFTGGAHAPPAKIFVGREAALTPPPQEIP